MLASFCPQALAGWASCQCFFIASDCPVLQTLLRGTSVNGGLPRNQAGDHTAFPQAQRGRSLTCVDVGVFLHVRLLVEAFPTELAGVGPSVRMDEQVGGQGG